MFSTNDALMNWGLTHFHASSLSYLMLPMGQAGPRFHFGGGGWRWAIILWGFDTFLIFPNFLKS